ncbi:sel1 repeat family protein [Cobetia marina]|uniref:tetratricopeptide repeat protein n=1 Tax=Cobetia marina TaxID=28258 RepID=UPI0010ADF9CA|nr:tetratricopeptide repeat protein [Cobetia marina]TKD64156.1 sel1 repeat family protein [Cobetia marina]GED43550.1 hypothetical protein HHA02_28790 [Cobetia marina]
MKLLIATLLSVIAPIAQAQSLFQSPDRDGFNQMLASYSKADIACIPDCKVDNKKKKYIVSVLSLSDAYNSLEVPRNCKFAYDTLTDLWRNGVNDAGYELSRMYYHGVCTEVDLAKSKAYLLKTANDGYVPSQKLLGKSYFRDEIQSKLYRKDLDKSAFWLSKSAAAGDAESASIISVLYKKGLSFEKDAQKSFYWSYKAFEAKYGGGPGPYSYRLADYYENGYGVDKDLIQSYKFYDLTGTAGMDGKERVSKNMTDAEIEEAIKQSRAWQEEHNTFVPSYYGLEHQSDGSYR